MIANSATIDDEDYRSIIKEWQLLLFFRQKNACNLWTWFVLGRISGMIPPLTKSLDMNGLKRLLQGYPILSDRHSELMQIDGKSADKRLRHQASLGTVISDNRVDFDIEVTNPSFNSLSKHLNDKYDWTFAYVGFRGNHCVIWENPVSKDFESFDFGWAPRSIAATEGEQNLGGSSVRVTFRDNFSFLKKLTKSKYVWRSLESLSWTPRSTPFGLRCRRASINDTSVGHRFSTSWGKDDYSSFSSYFIFTKPRSDDR